jgi:putative hydrolase of the HAD superfamily
MPIRAVLFDYGHTLVDFRRTEEALREAYQQIRGRVEAAGYIQMHELLDLIERVVAGVDQIVEASYAERRLEELDLVTVMTESLEAVGFSLPSDVVDHIIAIYHSAFANSLRVTEETMRTLEQLREDGYRLGLVSNVTLLPHLMRADLEALGLAAHLDAATFSSEVGVRKPHPKIFQTVLKDLRVSGAEAAFVGDRLLDDVSGARELGMRTVLTHEFRQEEDPEVEPDAVIGSLRELPAVLQSWR